MSKLSDLLNSQPVTARQAAEIADQRGVSLPYGTIAAYWSGRHGRPSARTLERLAEVLTIPLTQLQMAAWSRTAPAEDWTPPPEVRLLNDRQRRALDELIRSFAATQEENNEDTSTPGSTGNQEGDGSIGVDGAPMKPKHPDNVRQLTRPNQPEEVDEDFDDTAPPPEALDFVARETPPGYKKGYDIDREDDDS